MSRDDSIQFGERLSLDGDFDAEVLDPSRMRFQEIRLAKKPVELGRIVELLAGIEEWERFGTNSLAGPKDCVVKKSEIRCFSGFGVFEAAECMVTDDAEQSLVYQTANFWRQSEEAACSLRFCCGGICTVAQKPAVWAPSSGCRRSRHGEEERKGESADGRCGD